MHYYLEIAELQIATIGRGYVSPTNHVEHKLSLWADLVYVYTYLYCPTSKHSDRARTTTHALAMALVG